MCFSMGETTNTKKIFSLKIQYILYAFQAKRTTLLDIDNRIHF